MYGRKAVLPMELQMTDQTLSGKVACGYSATVCCTQSNDHFL